MANIKSTKGRFLYYSQCFISSAWICNIAKQYIKVEIMKAMNKMKTTNHCRNSSQVQLTTHRSEDKIYTHDTHTCPKMTTLTYSLGIRVAIKNAVILNIIHSISWGMIQIPTSFVCFDSDMYNSTNTVVYFDGNDSNLYLSLRAMSHTIYAAKFDQMITH
jgi:hypothetical protein